MSSIKATNATALACVAWLLCACSPYTMKGSKTTPRPFEHAPSAVKVGTGRADLTMPPGAATFGHALDARIAEGYWTRAYCRVFLFETARGERVAIIPCELASMSALLQRKVAKRVKDLLHPSQIMMTAVHTHAGVGHYFGELQYTGPFSSRRPAYDKKLTNALADRIADAIRDASSHMRDARLSWRHAHDFWCFQHNRDLAAYELNETPWRRMPSAADVAACPQLTRKDYQAVDPDIDVLRIDEVDPDDREKVLGPIGSISLFAMHPTVLPSGNRLFGGDTTGMVNREVERELRRTWARFCNDNPGKHGCDRSQDPLHGVINTNEGDIAPNWTRGDIDEAIELGQKLARFVWERHPEPASGAKESLVDLRYVEDDIRGATYHDEGTTKPSKTCTYASLGQGAAGGATDHVTTVAGLPLFESDPPTRSEKCADCQGVKRPLLGPLSVISRAEGNYPAVLPLGVVQIDDTLLAFLPAEATITAGHLITDRMLRVARRYSDVPKRAVIAGLANSYLQYLATADEYQLQGYEGSSTIYGPNENGYFADRMALLTRSLFDKDTEIRNLGVAGDLEFPNTKSQPRMARPTHEERERKHLRTCTMPGTDDAVATEAGSEIAPRICMYWRDDGPGDVKLREAPWMRLVDAAVAPNQLSNPVRVCRQHTLNDGETHCDPNGTVDDTGHEFRTRIHEDVGGGFIWSTLLSPDAKLWKELGARSVRIEAQGRQPFVRSTSFSRDALPCACTTREARLCIDGQTTEDWSDVVPPEARKECVDR